VSREPGTPTAGHSAPAVGHAARAAGLEGRVAKLLRYGTYSAVGLLAIGVVMMLVGGGSPLDTGSSLNPATLIHDLVQLRLDAFLWLGLLVVLATPATRVAVSVVGFWRAGDRGMAGVAILILCVIAIGVAIGTAGG
jgi:uncharacterized membrane protein